MEKLEKIENEIIDFLKENDDILSEMIYQCYMYDNSLEDYYWYYNDDDFYNTFFQNNVIEAVRSVSFSDNFNFYDNYVKFNAYGNLETATEWDIKENAKAGAEEIFNTWYDLYIDNNSDNDFKDWNFDDLLEKYEEVCQ